jgi:hypothetical protein
MINNAVTDLSDNFIKFQVSFGFIAVHSLIN